MPTSDRALRYNLKLNVYVVVPCRYLHFYFVDYHANFNSTGNKALPLRSMRGLSRLSLIYRVSQTYTYCRLHFDDSLHYTYRPGGAGAGNGTSTPSPGADLT